MQRHFAPALRRMAVLSAGLLAILAVASGPVAMAAPAAESPADKALATVPAWEFESNNASAAAGTAAVTLGDVNGDGFSDVAVGAPNFDGPGQNQTNGGAVFVFFGRATGPALAPDQSFFSDRGSFGETVAPAGDVNGDGYHDMLVGAPRSGDGRAYVYLGSAGGLQASPVWQYLHNDGNAAASYFGSSLATAGDINADGYDDIIIGAWNNNGGQGAAFVWLGNSGGVNAGAQWSTGGSAGWLVGAAVAGAGDVNGDGNADFLVGRPGASGTTPQGAAWYGDVVVFHGTAAGTGVATTYLQGAQAGASHGAATAGVGDVNGDGFADVAVGSPAWDWPGAVDAGRALVFPGSAGGVGTTAIWEEWGIAAGARFGATVAPAGDVNGDGLADAAAGAPGNVTSTAVANRYAVVVEGSRTGIGAMLIKWSSTRNDATGFAWAVATAGDVNGDGFSDLIVGSPGFSNGQSAEGRAEIFLGQGAGPYALYAEQYTYAEESTYFGWQTTTVGDVNGDGYSDVAVSGPGIDFNTTDDGLLQLRTGSPTGLQPAGQWAGEEAGGSFGGSVAAAGDVNGDGYDDMIVGAVLTNGSGRAYCWYGSDSGPSFGAADWAVSQGTNGAWFGASVAGAGDVNLDGYADVIVGAPFDENDQANEGRAYLFLGSASGLSTSPAWIVEGNQVDANLGISVAGAGDVNGDRFSDVVIGVDHWTANFGIFWLTNCGRVQVFHGQRQGGLAAAAATTIDGSNSFMQFGSMVAPAGDIDGDGFADVIVAARYADLGYADEGQVAVYRGSNGGLQTAVHWSVRGAQNFANFGSAVAGAGDVNGDGLSDIIVGANFMDTNNLQDNGEARVYAGPLTGLSGILPLWSYRGQQSLENLGNSVGSGGDINGDGFADVLTGSPGWTDSFWGQGRMLVFYGNDRSDPANTLSWKAQQRRGDDSAPLGLLADAGLPPTMRLRAEGSTASGGGDVRLEWELKQHTQILDGTDLVRGVWSSQTKNGQSFTPSVESGPIALPAGTTIHWRARVASRSPYMLHSRWFSPQGNGVNEPDLRTRNSALTGTDIPTRAPGGMLPVVAAPNPFNPSTTLRFDVPRADHVRVEIFDLRGALVRSLLDEPRPAGPAVLAWDGLDQAGRPVGSGAYQARVTAGTAVGHVRVMLLK